MRQAKRIVLIICMIAVMAVTASSSAFAAGTARSSLTAGCDLTPGEAETVSLFLENSDQIIHSWRLSATGLANSYELYFSVGGAPADAVTVQPGAKTQADLMISMKGAPVQNEDIIAVKSVRDDGVEETMSLSVTVSKDYAVSISSMQNQIDTLNGKSVEMTFSVKNTGAKELTAVNIDSELPYKWIAVRGSNEGVRLKPGETETVKLTIDVPASQASGNFTAKFSAVSNETKSRQISVPVTVKTGTGIGYWMAAILLLIAGFTLFQFKKHGRR